MSRARFTPAKPMPSKVRAGRRRKSPAKATTLPPSPQEPTSSALVPVSTKPDTRVDTRTAAERLILPSNSLVRQKVLAIISMRLEGKDNDEIAKVLGISPNSIKQYMYLAGRNGWLKNKAVDPNDRLEHEIAHKVVRNLDEMLDSPDESRRDVATLKTADGMLFKRFAEQQGQAQPLAVIGVRIEMPANGTMPTIREDTTGGTPRWAEGEVIDAPKG